MNYKFKFLLLGFLLSLKVLGQEYSDSVYWYTPYFTIVYSELLEQPKEVFYQVACPNGTASRAGMDFFLEENLHTSDNDDYYNNEWDKGHMAPAASFNCNVDMLHETFSYVNSALQQESLNRGIWKKLENLERKLANDYSSVIIYIKVDFDDEPKRLKTGAAIPKGFYKEVMYGVQRDCYYFPNIRPEFKNLEDYKCDCR